MRGREPGGVGWAERAGCGRVDLRVWGRCALAAPLYSLGARNFSAASKGGVGGVGDIRAHAPNGLAACSQICWGRDIIFPGIGMDLEQPGVGM